MKVIRKVTLVGNSIAITIPSNFGLSTGDYVLIEKKEGGLWVRKISLS
jgi:virulence-associated protein VagC